MPLVALKAWANFKKIPVFILDNALILNVYFHVLDIVLDVNSPVRNRNKT